MSSSQSEATDPPKGCFRLSLCASNAALATYARVCSCCTTTCQFGYETYSARCGQVGQRRDPHLTRCRRVLGWTASPGRDQRRECRVECARVDGGQVRVDLGVVGQVGGEQPCRVSRRMVAASSRSQSGPPTGKKSEARR